MVVEFLHQHRDVLPGLVLQLAHAAHGLLGGRVLVFAVETVENLDVDPHAHGPARHESRHLVVVERTASDGRHLRQEIGTLDPHALLGQFALERHLAEQRVARLREVLVIGQILDLREQEHRRHRTPVALAAQGVRQCAGDGLGLQFGICQLAFGLGHLELHVEAFGLGDHAVAFERPGVFEVLAHAVDHLLAHLDDLRGEGQSEITLHEFRDQRVAGLVALFDGRLLVDPRGAVRGVDLAAHPDRDGHFAAHETEAPVLHLEEPVGIHHRVQKPLNALYDGRIGDDAAAEDFPRKVLGRTFHLVEVESDVLGHVGVCARDVDLRHAKADGRAALLLCGALLVGRGFQRRVLREGDGDRLVEREHPPGFLCGRRRRNHRCRHEGDFDSYFHSIHAFIRQR